MSSSTVQVYTVVAGARQKSTMNITVEQDLQNMVRTAERERIAAACLRDELLRKGIRDAAMWREVADAFHSANNALAVLPKKKPIIVEASGAERANTFQMPDCLVHPPLPRYHA